ncbi:TIGR02302 family protein [Mesorhizobium sp. M1A.T.Ca.IN.004.03.1.1]|uniref:TIGR02302 family protein n=2 Tax=Mesorhizobium TaxID=68287 RepID=UPI000FC9EC15|nr:MULTISPECIES: TIGR02302 family protein [unclassified Mesorhizobium]RUV43045.1 TIGR02302 family protein [Mesorhizobium sp. M1A.T.Ca.IN.004.03.1.1]RWK89837.1 MAG: TIGR02302 family protein [Mesorhizobium sp.]
MTERPISSDERGLAGRLALTRLATRASMIFERGWPLLLPLAVVAGLFLSVSWLGLFQRLPDLARIGLLILFSISALAALFALRLFRIPSAAEVDRRIEAANELLHSPVQVQTDRPSGADSLFSQALWREHQKRMAERLSDLGADRPRTSVPDYDRWGLRAVVGLLFVTAFAFSFGPFGGRISDGFVASAARDSVPPRIDAWVTPPSYTGKPPLFLTADVNQAAQVFSVPEGSDVSLRVTGGTGEETLSYADANGNDRAIEPVAPKGATPAAAQPGSPAGLKVRQFSGKLNTNGTLRLKSGEDDLGHWAFAIIPDKPPTIRFVGEPKRAVNGAIELNYQIDDDYGAASAKAVLELSEPPPANAHPLYGPPDMPLTLPRRGGKANAAKTTKDLTEHVWAGSTIKLTLTATDDAGHTATSETKTLVMPERPFSNPLARAVIEQRRLLALDANAKPRVLDLMDAITLRPEDTFDNMSHYLAIMSARSRLKLAENDDQLRNEVAYLWEIALGIEEGNLSAAERRLRQAQQALQDAIKNGASDEELEKAMKELREAMNQFLQEFAQRAQQNPNAPQMQQNGRELRQSDINRMMDEIENLAKSGDRDRAQQLLSELQDMMNNLQAGRQQQAGLQDSEMRQQMDKLGEIMRRQQEMMNDTFRLDQMQRGDRQRGANRDEQLGEDGEQSQDGQKPGDDRDPLGRPKQMTPQEFADALKQLQEGQGQLQSELDKLKKGLEGMGMQPNEGFGEAGKSMGDAEQALGEGEGDQAVGHQGRALEALRRGAKEMMKQMQAMQGDQGGSEQGGRRQDADRDPLGRPRATKGPDDGNSVKVPDEIDVQRARQILEAIRKRLGNALSPDIERSYLERLLELK